MKTQKALLILGKNIKNTYFDDFCQFCFYFVQNR